MNIHNVNLTNKTIIVTGAAGFVGSNLVMEHLRSAKATAIIDFDNLNDYYDISLKEYRLQQI